MTWAEILPGLGSATQFAALLLSPLHQMKHCESNAGSEPITESHRDEKLIKELLQRNKY